MRNDDLAREVANYMGAIAHLLSGGPGRLRELVERVELVISGTAPDAVNLMNLAGRVAGSGRPVLWFHCEAARPDVPRIGLVAQEGGRTYFVENCLLWLSAKDDRARLVPDAFDFRSWRFDDRLRLRRFGKAPARSMEDARGEVARGYARLEAIQEEQRARGETFDLLTRSSHRAAA